MKNTIKRLGYAVAGVAATAAPALADPWAPTFTVDTAPVFTVATAVVSAIAGIWAIKKVIKLANRS